MAGRGFVSPNNLGRFAQGQAAGVPAQEEAGFISIGKRLGWNFMPARVPQTAVVIITASQYMPGT